jgi:hypothetical protein
MSVYDDTIARLTFERDSARSLKESAQALVIEYEQLIAEEIDWWEGVREDHGPHILVLREAQLKVLRSALE